MARVPFVGRLHLYLPIPLPFRSRMFAQKHSETIVSEEEVLAVEEDEDENLPALATLEPAPASEPRAGIEGEKEEDGGVEVKESLEQAGEESTLQHEDGEGQKEEGAAPGVEVELISNFLVSEVEAEAHTSSFSTSSSNPRRRRRSFEQGEEKPANNSPPKSSIEYIALFFSFLFLVLESVLRIVTSALPTPVINFFYSRSRSLFNHFSPFARETSKNSKAEKDITAKVRDADGFVDLCELWNKDGKWRIEEHVVQTRDGYLLGLHRVVKKDAYGEGRSSTSRGRGNGGKRVVYLHHGLLMNSEVWVCQLEKDTALPFILADKGFDVWLGNNRGNKYSKKSIHYPSSSPKFWEFSIDDFAFYDIPDSINYILDTTGQKSLSYVGFSQGTAQAFATLSIHPRLNEKVDVFIALAPAMSPHGLHNSVVDALMKASPNLMYLFFGRKSILGSTTFWQSVLYPPIFVRVIDMSLSFLFAWSGRNISPNQKLASYSHLYSYTSVKSVVHWFQIIRNKSFQMYDDEVQAGLTSTLTGRSFYKVAKFPTRNITTPIVLLYGGSDSLVDINVMLKELPSHTVAKETGHYEHLDFLWGKEVDTLVYPHVVEALEKYAVDDDFPFKSLDMPFSALGDLGSAGGVASMQRVSDEQAKEVEEQLEAAVQARLAAKTPITSSPEPLAHTKDEAIAAAAPTNTATTTTTAVAAVTEPTVVADTAATTAAAPASPPPLALALAPAEVKEVKIPTGPKAQFSPPPRVKSFSRTSSPLANAASSPSPPRSPSVLVKDRDFAYPPPRGPAADSRPLTPIGHPLTPRKTQQSNGHSDMNASQWSGDSASNGWESPDPYRTVIPLDIGQEMPTSIPTGPRNASPSPRGNRKRRGGSNGGRGGGWNGGNGAYGRTGGMNGNGSGSGVSLQQESVAYGADSYVFMGMGTASPTADGIWS